ncbi:nitrate- and nitrite sensing domain-containing protein [Nucisporomicrobium flavum]|uniref:sensor histidine kinase n=1 Tax=Nucisporomicrobium flavum TaxID=2785915 RepID=UPI0018F599D1|nr:nitrate- and nitrite sensing domain-containing protein [Nucisporomicrobium flavum]
MTSTRVRSRLWAWTAGGLLVVLWAAAAVPLTLDAAGVVRAHATTRQLGEPVDAVIVQLQEERRLSAGFLADVVTRDALAAQRRRTDDACTRLRDTASGSLWRTAAGARTARATDDLVRRLDERQNVRATVDGGKPGVTAVVDRYTALVATAFTGAPWLWPDGESRTGSALLGLGRAREALSQEDAAVIGDPGGARSAEVRARVVRLATTRRVLLAEAADRLPASAREKYDALAAEPRTTTLAAWEDRLAAAPPTQASAPPPALDAYRTGLRDLEVAAVRRAREDAVPAAVVTVAGAGLLAGVGLVAVIAVLVRLRRGFSGSRSRKAATASSPPADAHELELVLEQNRRNQALLHRQLRMLDNLQRRVGDDGTLGELFRIDHLASRVRRNVEKTIALTGGTPGRRWTVPVPLTEVVRAAAAEVPGFERVSTAQVEPAALAGTAVVDVMHLLAELVENAVTFSSADTRVRVSGAWDADGYVLTVADHGPGMDDDDLRAAADVLAATTPPPTRAWDGLYATGRLADRCGAAVALRNADGGGLLAEVRLPAALLHEAAGATEATIGLPPADPAPEASPAPRRRTIPAQRLPPGASPAPARPARPGPGTAPPQKLAPGATPRKKPGTGVTTVGTDE